MSSLVLFDFDKTIVSTDTGTAYMKFMLLRSPLRLIACLLASPLVLVFLPFNKTKCISFSILLWLFTVGMPFRKVATLRSKFMARHLENTSTVVYQHAVERIRKHVKNKDRVVVVSGASQWMVKKVFAHLSLPQVEFACSQETRFIGGMISRFHCYAENKVKRIKPCLSFTNYQSIIGYSDSAVDIPLLALCTHRFIVNPKPNCLKKLTKSFNQSMSVVDWA
ncbi:HAD-IB family phosphatase [Alteromonas sp. C1M14]|uniref:HAD-IB family phosphatase n=1 Tax=Alteromonas sp. C1M14 TaxID=2841567 RepID=UPI001C08010B|nr:HAD-IB family phosphatase [Alteromonas sp. C1M14]MBU2978734.1 HAD-IB family phosphatase [Alteromonas sp. C1M14]